MQISEDEIRFLTGGDDPDDDNVVLNKLFHPNLKLLVVTEGSEGCRYFTKVSVSGQCKNHLAVEMHDLSYFLEKTTAVAVINNFR